MTGPRILFSIPNTLSTRNLLRSDVLPRLEAEAERIVIVTPFDRDPAFQREFARGNIVLRPMPRYRPSRAEDALMRASYNLHVATSAPHSLRLLLERWGERHPRLAPFRKAAIYGVLSRMGRLTPLVDRWFLAAGGETGYEALLAEERPTLAVFTRLFYCDEIPLMKAAVRAGVPTVGVVASWDNLTTKGPLMPPLDTLVVWNDLMQREAADYHGYPAARVAVTGAPQHDVLYGGPPPSRTREQLFAGLGLDPARRLLVYAGEDQILAPDAPLHIERVAAWIAEGRLAEPCQILIRPHPQEEIARYERLRGLPHVHFDLPGRVLEGHWMDMSWRDLLHLYDTLRHADMVLNVTSTMVVDAALVDTPSICIGFVYTQRDSYYHSPMRYYEMTHFKYVIDADATTVAASEAELLDGINRYLRDPGHKAEGRARIGRAITQFDDGRSSARTAAAILAGGAKEPAA